MSVRISVEQKIEDLKPMEDPSYDYPQNYVPAKKFWFWIDWLQVLMQNCSGSLDSREKIRGLAESASQLSEIPPEVQRIVHLVKDLAEHSGFYHPALKNLAKEAHLEMNSKSNESKSIYARKKTL